MTGPTVPTPAIKFYQPRQSDLIWLPACAGTFPTLAEVNAGTVISKGISAINGFTTTVSDLAAKEYGDSWVGSIPGDETPDTSSFMAWAEATEAGSDLGSVMTKNQVGHLFAVWQGLAASATSKCTFWKNVRVATVNRPPDMTNISQITIPVTLGEAPVDGAFPTT